MVFRLFQHSKQEVVCSVKRIVPYLCLIVTSFALSLENDLLKMNLQLFTTQVLVLLLLASS